MKYNFLKEKNKRGYNQPIEDKFEKFSDGIAGKIFIVQGQFLSLDVRSREIVVEFVAVIIRPFHVASLCLSIALSSISSIFSIQTDCEKLLRISAYFSL